MFFMNLTNQLKARREQLGLLQTDMKLRVGMNQQQYQRIEKGGNPRLNTLALLAEGLDAQLLLVPKEKLPAVLAVLENMPDTDLGDTQPDQDPWSDIL